MDLPVPKPFRPDGGGCYGDQWAAWKEAFEIYICAKGLDDAAGKRKVCLLLHLLGPDGIKIYNTFEFKAEIPAAN